MVLEGIDNEDYSGKEGEDTYKMPSRSGGDKTNWNPFAQGQKDVCIEEAIPEVRKVKVTPSDQLHLEKVLTALGAKYPLAHLVTRHFILASGPAHGCFAQKNAYQGHHWPSE